MRVTAHLIILAVLQVVLAWPAQAETSLYVAVASNFTGPMEEIAQAFTNKTGIKVQSSYSSTGKLYAMIKNGAPIDLFLAADSHRPELLHSSGMAGKPFIYAQGRAVLWTANKQYCTEEKNWLQVARSSKLKQIAIANPGIAPYGQVIKKVINGLPDQREISSRFVYTQNVAQAFQYAERIVNAGFTSASFALSKPGKTGCYWPIPEAKMVLQKGCVIQQQAMNSNTEAFVSFLEGPEAETIIESFGYTLPREQ